MANDVVRAAAKQAGVKFWEVADYCGMADTTLSRKMRKELPAEITERREVIWQPGNRRHPS